MAAMSQYFDNVVREINAAGLNSPQLVIFDCDGVLVDSELLACRIEAELFQQIGLSLSAEEIGSRFVGLSYATMEQQISAEFGIQLPDDFESSYLDTFSQAIESDLDPVPGIEGLLDRIPYPICLASSSPMTRIDRSLAVTGLSDYFSKRIFSAQMVSRGKPAPDLFLLAAEQCGAAPEHCLVIEDSSYGIEAAVAAGMSSIGFTAGSHCSATHKDILAAAGADLLAADSGQLETIFEALSLEQESTLKNKHT
jgi:HAD superfamily hydrolase (TIGR01509 family)